MKKFITCFLFLFALCSLFSAYAKIVEPTVSSVDAKWWMKRYGRVQYSWTDHTGRARTIVAPSTNEVIESSYGVDVTIRFTSNLVWQTYTVGVGNLNEDYSYSLDYIAPGTYTNGLFYTQMTDAQKTELWVAYTNKVIQAQYAHLEKKYADAKFDVSMDPEEYRALLMKGRTKENLLPEEKRVVDTEYRTYYDEWLRINDPDRWDLSLVPRKGEVISERAKKLGREGKGIIVPRSRSVRARAVRTQTPEEKIAIEKKMRK